MSYVADWIRDYPKGITFKCTCGATVNLKGWVENSRFWLSAKCWRCNKELEQVESTLLVESACFNMIPKLIERFIKIFNCDKKQQPCHIHVVK